VLNISAVNGGSPYRQWIKGLDYAEGKYIWIAESDDEADPQFLSALVDVMEATPEAAFAVSNWERVDAEGRALAGVEQRLPLDKPIPLFDGCHQVDTVQLLAQMVEINPLENVSCMLIRAGVLRAATAGVEDFRYLGDWYTYLRLLQQGSLLYIDKTLARHRLHNETTRVRPFDAKNHEVFLAEYLRVTRDAADMAGITSEKRDAAIRQVHYHTDLRRNIETAIAALGERKKIAIYGAAAMGRQTLSLLRQTRADIRVAFLIDAIAERGKEFSVDGIPVIDLAAFLPHASSVDGILIASCNYYDEILAMLAAEGLGDLVKNRM